MNTAAPEPPPLPPLRRRLRLEFELCLLFFGIPTLLVLPRLRRAIIPVLVFGAGACVVALCRDRTFDRRRLWNAAAVPRQLPRTLLVFLVAGSAISAALVIFWPDHLFAILEQHPGVWALLMVVYPLISVYPQEIIYRAFLFHRYRAILRRPWMLIAASAVTFGYAHIIFMNWQAVFLTVLGGVLFAWTYHRTRSLLAAWIEHALYGWLMFTVGGGKFFFHGTLRFIERLSK